MDSLILNEMWLIKKTPTFLLYHPNVNDDYEQMGISKDRVDQRVNWS
jgi:hypothetical protein